MNDQLFAHTKPYDPALLNPATNMETPGILKPQGGLWTSTHTENGSEWVEWTCLEEFRYRYHTWATSTAVDWALIQQKYDGVHLTGNGHWETRYPTNPTLGLGTSSWDCESTVWFRDVFEVIMIIERENHIKEDPLSDYSEGLNNE